jgi:DMSO/TMAO reductase YedYZ heme-binding membrane subunit
MLKSKLLNDWNLLWLIVLPVSVAVVVAMAGADLSSGEGVSSMIQFSVRCAVPWLYLAFAASSLYALFPSELTRWLFRNRKIMGLSFAFGMAWQGVFILLMVTRYGDYYINEVYVLRDVIEGLLGYVLLIAMTITTFKSARRRIGPKRWRWLHKTGIYFLWAYAFSVYWYELFYYEEATCIDYVYYWAGFLAFAVRVAAWIKASWLKAAKKAPDTSVKPTLLATGIIILAIGLVGAVFGSSWGGQAEQFLSGYAIPQWLELYFPYYPPVPFLPPFALALGGVLVARSREGGAS